MQPRSDSADTSATRRGSPEPLHLQAPDGFPLRGQVWRHAAVTAGRPVVVINAATSVRCRYYARFAAFLHAQGFDALTYDYRGIGGSRPVSLRRLEAGWLEWGRLDFEGVLRYVERAFPGQPVQVVGHSVGGFLIGLAPSSERLQRVVTVGAQYAYWRDYACSRRLRMLCRWHLVMPTLTTLLGYFPGRRLGWLEDTPRGVVRDWTARAARFEDAYRRGPRRLPPAQRQALVKRFAALRAPMLAIGIADDPFGTVAAVRRLLRYYRGSPRTHLVIAPDAIGVRRIGHFAFFHDRFHESLWPLALAWLRSGQLPPCAPGQATRFSAEAPESEADDTGPGPAPREDSSRP